MVDTPMRDRPRKLLVAGHVNVDRFFRLPDFPEDDRTVPVMDHRVALGGTAGNIAMSAAALGVACGLAARVGDGFPAAFRARLRDRRIDLRGLESRPDLPTPTAYILEDARGRQRTLMDQGAMGDRVGGSVPRYPWLREYSWVHVTTGPPRRQLELKEAARWAGARIAVDPAQEVHYRWDASGLRRLLDGAEILFGNRSEIERIARELGASDADDLLGRVPLVVETLGPRGARAHTRAGTVRVPAVRPHRIRSVVGAGDHFRGGFYAAWFHGEDLEGCLGAGVHAAARGMEGGAKAGGSWSTTSSDD